ncbi:hypothetical protein [Clostridium tyrobutyricum]|jgi:hypothetical protein|uniref:hypothetical protein n=1 Tax=Clostridium tyrobutyricum TaxID=1519 RepID=UPI0010A9FDB1|nr:hypothetical protein [Clostridium tyrobutyricum]QCH29071.1 hypothetical protein EZN00_02696 [Clostridium tyrobutyricum]
MYHLAEMIVALIVVALIIKWALKSIIEDVKGSISTTFHLIKMINKNSKKDFIKAKDRLCNSYKLYKTNKIKHKNKK